MVEVGALEWAVWLIMGAGAVGLHVLLLTGRLGRRLLRDVCEAGHEVEWPRVSVIVPLSGSDPNMEPCLHAVMEQDYANYEVLLVTRAHGEEAAAVARRAVSRARGASNPLCRHIASGRAVACGQKNHNLLAGIERAAGDSEIFVFLDGSHQAPRHWLRSLVRPIARGNASVATGYHHLIPEDFSLGALGRAVVVLTLQCAQETGWLTQPWGGNTAISRAAFEAWGVEAIWRQSVVDDVSLETILKRRGQKARFVASAQLRTPMRTESFMDWHRWLKRQILYLKFGLPVSWLLAGGFLLLFAGALLFSVFRTMTTLLGCEAASTIVPDIFLSLLLLSGAGIMRSFHPAPPPLARWLAASFAAVLTAAFCHVCTWFTREMEWRGVRYTVARGGWVTGIREDSTR